MSFIFKTKAISRVDWLNIGILTILFGCMLLLVPPAHQYSVTDDWAYAHSVQDMVRLNYSPNEWSMAISLTHVALGAVFVWLFGFSFTVLTASNLIISLIGVILFYFLLRQLDVVPAYALFGAAVLFLNPMYIYLSYSYMTDVPFVTYSTAALLCYVIGIKRKNGPGSHGWLLAGSVFVSLAYLVRQLGAILIVAILIYLLWESLKPIQIRRMIATALLPCIVIVVYAAWESTFHLTLAAYVQASFRAGVHTNFPAWLSERLVQLAGGSFLLGLMLLPLLSLPPAPARNRLLRLLWIAIPFGVIFYLLFLGVQETGSWVWHNYGNILDNTGFLMQSYHSAPLFNSSIWLLLSIVSVAGISVFIVAVASRLADSKLFAIHSTPQLSSQVITPSVNQNAPDVSTLPVDTIKPGFFDWTRRIRLGTPNPRMLVFLSGIITFVITAALSYVTTDRYWLPIFPPLITAAITSIGVPKSDEAQATANLRPSLLRWAMVGCIALGALIGQQDYMARASARWEAGKQLLAKGIPADKIYMGIEWSGWYLSDEGLQYFRQHGTAVQYIDANPAEAVIDPIYLASDVPVKGYSVVQSISYQSILRGGQRYVLVLKRDSAR